MKSATFSKEYKLWIAKEQVKDLERLLKEAQDNLNLEYEKNGGRNWWQWFWFLLGYYYD